MQKMFNEHQRIISDVVTEYPNMFKIVVYRNDYVINRRTDISSINEPKKVKDNSDRSLRRSRQAIYDYVMCNKFDYWCTFTFDDKKVGDRYNSERCKYIMRCWLHNQRMHSPNLKYVIIPEYHKKCRECVETKRDECAHDNRQKAIHFHALIANFNGKLREVKNIKSKQPIYNATGYRSGFTKFIKLYENDERLANYMTKYMTKDMPLFSGKKRYWVSQNLEKPKKHVNGLFTLNLRSSIWLKKPAYSTSEIEMFFVPKSDQATPLPVE